MAEPKIIIPDPQLQSFVNDVRKREADAASQAQPPVEVEKPVSEEGKQAVPKPTEEQGKPAAEIAPKETKIDNSQEQQPPVVEQTPAPEVTSWDTGTETPVVKAEPVQFDFKSLGSALDFGDVKDEKELITKVSELRTKLKATQDAPLLGVPDDFKEVVEVARKTGDWKTYLAESIIDYSKVSPIKLYEDQAYAELTKLASFRNADGSPNDAKISDEIAAVSDVTKSLEGSHIARYMSDQQQQRRAAIVNQAREKLQEKEKELVNATKDLNQLLPFESYGIKFEAKHSNNVYEGVATSRLTKKHLGVSYEDLVRSGADMKAVAKTIAAAEYGEQMLKFKSNASLVKAKKEILAKVENVQLTTPGVPAAPESKTKLPHEVYLEKLKAAQGKF
jgi:hypothetical protein